MIRIRKDYARTPQILLSKGIKARRAAEDCFDAGLKIPEALKSIFKNREVIGELRRIQHKKCCYCEMAIRLRTASDVEHFRPKAGLKQSKGEVLQKPGYYWLAYEFSNMFSACGDCNRIHKENVFPIQNPEQRSLNHQFNIVDEIPGLVHPEQDEPENHIAFSSYFAHGKSPIGMSTIELLNLNRPELVEARLSLPNHLLPLKQIASMGLPVSAAAGERLKLAASESAEYSAMVKANFKDLR